MDGVVDRAAGEGHHRGVTRGKLGGEAAERGGGGELFAVDDDLEAGAAPVFRARLVPDDRDAVAAVGDVVEAAEVPRIGDEGVDFDGVVGAGAEAGEAGDD